VSTINLSLGKQYLSQRDNKIRPLITCNVTSICMALIYSGYSLPEEQDERLPDALEEFMLTSQQVSDYYKSIDLAEWKNWQANKDNPKVCTPPNEYHQVLAYGVNLWLGSKADEFRTDVTMQEVILQFINGKATVHSGVWCGFHHIICAVGVNTEQDLSAVSVDGVNTEQDLSAVSVEEQIDLSQVKSIIVDDPYGRYDTHYSNPDGNDVEVPYNDFLAFTKTLQSDKQKFVHIFS